MVDPKTFALWEIQRAMAREAMRRKRDQDRLRAARERVAQALAALRLT